jgi:hypothetical protein
MLMHFQSSHSMPEETSTPPPPPSTNRASAIFAFIRGLSFSRVQSVVATLAGIVSVSGAAFSLVQYVRPANTGELVAIVKAAGSQDVVRDATVEVLTTEDALVATLTPDSAGRVMQELREGVYVVRVTHPRYAADVRRIQVQPQQTIEIRTALRAGSSSPMKRAVNKGVGAVRRALGF